MLAHKGSEEGIDGRGTASPGKPGHVNHDTIPWVIYTEPEIAWVGKTEAQLKAEGMPYKTGTFPFAAIGRARGDERDRRHGQGARPRRDRPPARRAHHRRLRRPSWSPKRWWRWSSTARAEDLARICHAHPTLSEAMHEAALAVDKRAIHKAN